MYVDTHCHLNFKRFERIVENVIARAWSAGVIKIIIPGTDIETSKKAVKIAEQNEGVFASVGIHPHHARELQITNYESKINIIQTIQIQLQNTKVKAVGEVGLDKHLYEKSKHGIHKITEEDIAIQKELLVDQIKMALEYNKSLILHNREAVSDLLETLDEVWDEKLRAKTVFHCCEPDDRLLAYAIKHEIFIGVDGDVTYDEKKQEFVRKIPLERLVVETDSPYLLPEPLRSQNRFPNEPSNIPIIIEKISEIKNLAIEEVAEKTYENSIKLFQI